MFLWCTSELGIALGQSGDSLLIRQQPKCMLGSYFKSLFLLVRERERERVIAQRLPQSPLVQHIYKKNNTPRRDGQRIELVLAREHGAQALKPHGRALDDGIDGRVNTTDPGCEWVSTEEGTRMSKRVQAYVSRANINI